jgi:hypothetical protein
VLSCHEQEEPTPLNYSKIVSGNISKTWSLRSISFRNTGDEDWKLTESCWSDDSYTFYRDERKSVFESGNVKCDAFDAKVTITNSWAFINANATLLFVVPLFSDNPIPFTVVDIDENDMVLELFFNDGGTQSYQLKFDLEDEE